MHNGNPFRLTFLSLIFVSFEEFSKGKIDMKRLRIIFFYLILPVIIFGQYRDISWNTPEVTSDNTHSFLEKNIHEKILFLYNTREPLENYSEQNFAFSSWNNFTKSLHKFFFYKEDNSVLFEYKTPDKIKKPSYSSWIHPSSIPLKSLLRFSLLTGCDFVTKDSNNYYFVHYGAKLSGYIQQRLFFYGYWWAGHFAGDMNYAKSSSLIDSWTQDSSDSDQIHLDNITSKITYIGKGNFWSLSIGRGKYEVGNNIGGSIILNDDCNDYGYFSSKFNFKALSISFLHASLIPDSTSSDNTNDYTDKYLVIHKIDWKPNTRFHFFLGENVIYGDRSISPSYLLPHVFLRPIEHNLRNRDNVLIFTGINWKPIPKNIIYFNFILDELKKSEIFSDWWGNKYAFQLGNSYTFNWDKDLILTFEFTAVRPWMYTHNIMHNKFSHDGIGLGFPEGSNLIQFAGEFNFDIQKNLNINLHASFTRHGSLGNNFSINYENCPSTAKWLEGDITDQLKISPVITWQPLAHHKLKFGMNISRTNDNDMEKEFIISYQAMY